jgi:integrase/recombinase XerD
LASPEQWNGKFQQVYKNHSEFQTINPLLRSISSKVYLYLLNAGENNTVVSFDDIKSIVLKLTNTNKGIKSLSLFLFRTGN